MLAGVVPFTGVAFNQLPVEVNDEAENPIGLALLVSESYC